MGLAIVGLEGELISSRLCPLYAPSTQFHLAEVWHMVRLANKRFPLFSASVQVPPVQNLV